MIINTQLTESDFIRVNFTILYKKAFVKFITLMAFFALIISVIGNIQFPGTTSLSQIMLPILILVILPLITYNSARKNFKTNKRINEPVEYSIDDKIISLKGESFNAQLSWEKIYKVNKTKEWILIWQNKQVANVIPRRNITDSQIAILKNIISNYKLKNDL